MKWKWATTLRKTLKPRSDSKLFLRENPQTKVRLQTLAEGKPYEGVCREAIPTYRHIGPKGNGVPSWCGVTIVD